MSEIALGLMSGTSADGVTAVLAKFEGKHFKLLGHLTHPYPPALRQKIHQARIIALHDLSDLNAAVGESFGQAANKILKKCRVLPKNVKCIGSHGQTLYHGPKDPHPNTLQIGDPARIAEKTGIDVVSNFRGRDIAAGGEGAPLVPYFDYYFFQNRPTRAFQNIGGISNVTVVGKGAKSPMAFDTGPGNCLMDIAMRRITNGEKDCDHNGGLAAKGEMDMEILNHMMSFPYFQKKPPKSTGLEVFNEQFINQYFPAGWEAYPENTLATLNYFTCLSIQEGYRRFIFPKINIAEIIVSGGGAHNKTLLTKLGCLFAPIPVKKSDKIGIPTMAREALAFAFFGIRRMHNKINHLPQTTGAKKECILGQITKA